MRGGRLRWNGHVERKGDVNCMKACTVPPRYNAVVGRHLLRPPYKRGALWDPVDLIDIVIPWQRYPGTNVNVSDLGLKFNL